MPGTRAPPDSPAATHIRFLSGKKRRRKDRQAQTAAATAAAAASHHSHTIDIPTDDSDGYSSSSDADQPNAELAEAVEAKNRYQKKYYSSQRTLKRSRTKVNGLEDELNEGKL